MKKAFTLLELIVVIVILGILATLGFTQYNKVVEKMRISEAVATIGSIRQRIQTYWLEYGNLSSITDADVGVGSSSDQIPRSCRNTHYFYYYLYNPATNNVSIAGYRCTSGGKVPNYTSGNQYVIYMHFTPSTGSGDFLCCEAGTGQPIYWCQP